MNTYKVDREKWAKLTIFEQMGNIGSEVGRSLGAKRRNDNASAESAMIRALDLFDATTQAWLTKKHYAKLRELLRSKEQYLQAYFGDTKDTGIENYFTNYAVAARLNR